jgi:plant 4alpha-monomethylsterol monooxygenase
MNRLWLASVAGTPLVSLAAFLLFGLLYALPRWLPALGATVLQRGALPSLMQLARAVGYTLVNHLATFALSLCLWPLYRRQLHLGALPAWWVIALQLGVFLVVDDALFYVAHRILHTSSWLMRHIHSWHHRARAPFALSGAVMHPVEWLIISSIVAVAPLALGMHMFVFWACVVLRQLGNAEFHAGVVGRWSLLSRVPGAGGVRHHDLHHARVRGNYASLFTLWDRVFGTELKDL